MGIPCNWYGIEELSDFEKDPAVQVFKRCGIEGETGS
jgi:hypothetical protein